MRSLDLEEDAAIDGLQWILLQNTPRLIVSSRSEQGESVLRFYASDDSKNQGPLNLLTLPRRLARPQWSLSGNSEETLRIALTRPGSAICPLAMWSPGSEEVAISDQKPGGVFQSPRFVRRAPKDTPPVIAVDPLAGPGVVVIFIPSGSDPAWDLRTLYQPEGGALQQALAVQMGDEYLLFYKIFVPGSVKTEADGAIPSLPHAHSGTVPPGILHCIRLNQDLQVSGKLFRPLGDELLFEFDADATDNRVAILGTTASGFIISEGRIDRDSFVETSRTSRRLPSPLSAPSVMIGENNLFLAVLESTGSSDARVLFAAVNAR